MMWAGRPASLACSGDRRLKRVVGIRDHLLALSRPSRVSVCAAVGWTALMPLPRSRATRFLWTWPAKESTEGT